MADQTITNKIDPAMSQAFTQNLQYAQGVANALPVQQFAGFDPIYQQGESQMIAAGQGIGASNLGTAADLTRVSGAYSPMQVGADQTAMLGYFNPYQQAVTNATMQQLGTAQQQAMNQANQQAMQARAFGGSRHGVAQALSNQAWGQQAANTLGNLNYQGWNQAQNLAQQAALANQQAGLAGAQFRLGAANQLGQMGQAQTAQQQQAAQNLMGLGGARQQLAQQQLDAARNLGMQRLGITSGALGLQPANLGVSQTSPMYQNRAATNMGLALGAAGLLSMPWGSGGGTVGGALWDWGKGLLSGW